MESTLVQNTLLKIGGDKVSAVSQAHQIRLIEEAKLPVRHAMCPVRNNNESWNKAYATVCSRIGSGTILMLCGTRGSGKTQIAIEALRHGAKCGKTLRYTSAMDFFMALKDSYRRDSRKSEYDVLAEHVKPSVLVIDEIGKRSDSDWENSLLFHLLDKRYCALKDTILISNQERGDALNGLGASLVSRIQETGGVIECSWKSFREARP